VKSDFERVRSINDAMQAGDLQTVSGFLHPDVVWEHNLGVGSPEEGVYRGRDNVIGLLERILDTWEYLRPEPREIRALGGGSFEIRGELRAKHSTSNTEVVSTYGQHFELSDGLMVRMSMVTREDLEWKAGDIDVVRQVVEAFRDRDVARLRTLFDEDSEFASTIAALEGGTYRGRDGIERYMHDLDDVFDDWHSEDERYVDVGNGQVVFVYRIVGRGKGSGVPIDEEAAISWMVRDGKVLRGKVYLDPEEALGSVE
jgi:ketosteroid isomerase-like protein